MKELTNEMQNLLELLISEDDANFELGKIILPNYKEQFLEYLNGGNFSHFVKVYHFYNQWFANIEFSKMEWKTLNYLHHHFCDYKNYCEWAYQNGISRSKNEQARRFLNAIEEYFVCRYNASSGTLTSCYNGEHYTHINFNLYTPKDLKLFYKDIHLD